MSDAPYAPTTDDAAPTLPCAWCEAPIGVSATGRAPRLCAACAVPDEPMSGQYDDQIISAEQHRAEIARWLNRHFTNATTIR